MTEMTTLSAKVSGYYVVYLHINIHEGTKLTEFPMSRLYTSVQPAEDHMAISLICMSRLYDTWSLKEHLNYV